MNNIIAIVNQKGGCGKTTTSINLSASIASRGKKVLLIDLDPQGHATLGLNIREDRFKKSMYDVLSNLTNIGLDDIIIPVSENLDLAPSNILLSAIEQQLSGISDREERLAENIKRMKREYSFIIFDCPPSLGLLTFNALIACNKVIIPIETSFFSLQGVMKLLETINLVKEGANSELKFKALITMYDRRKKFDQEIMKNIKDYFKEECFGTVIRSNVKLKECASFGCPITQYDKNCAGFEDYTDLANEVFAGCGIPEKRIEIETEHKEAVTEPDSFQPSAASCQEQGSKIEEGIPEPDSYQLSAVSSQEESETEVEEATPERDSSHLSATSSQEQESEAEEVVSKPDSSQVPAISFDEQESKVEEVSSVQVAEQKEEEKFEEVVPEQVWDEVTFSYWSPEAKMVQIAGDFNNWSSEGNIKLEKKGDGLWEAKLPLKRGTYQYKYIVDGDWRIDPNNPLKVTNSFGFENSLLELKREN